MMADAAFQLTGKPGVLVATLGPGITNTTTAVAQALLDRSAVVVLTGEIATSLKGVYTHQIIDQEFDDAPRSSKKWGTDPSPRPAFEQVRKGLAIGLRLRCRARCISTCRPMVAGPSRPTALLRRNRATRPAARDGLRAGARRLKRSRSRSSASRAARRAQRQLAAFSKPGGCRFVAIYKAKGVLPEDHELCVGATGLSPVVDKIHMARFAKRFDPTIGFDPVELRSDWMAPWDEKQAQR